MQKNPPRLQHQRLFYESPDATLNSRPVREDKWWQSWTQTGDKVKRVIISLNAQECGRLTREFDVALFIQENATKQQNTNSVSDGFL